MTNNSTTNPFPIRFDDAVHQAGQEVAAFYCQLVIENRTVEAVLKCLDGSPESDPYEIAYEIMEEWENQEVTGEEEPIMLGSLDWCRDHGCVLVKFALEVYRANTL